MRTLARASSTLRGWLGLADAPDSHPTASHGWLLASADTLERLKREQDTRPGRGARLTP